MLNHENLFVRYLRPLLLKMKARVALNQDVISYSFFAR